MFTLPGKTPEQSVRILDRTRDWPSKYELLQQTAGYDPRERARKLSKKEEEEEVAISSEVPDGEDIEAEVEQEIETENPANRKETPYSVKECRMLWDELLKESLLTEAPSTTRQWSISPAQLKTIATSVDYETLGSLPYSTKKIVQVAEQYMKYLSDNLLSVFESTKNLSENLTEYFTFRNRSKAITSGEGAIQDSNTIGDEMSRQLSQDTGIEESIIHETAYTQGLSNSGEQGGKTTALFPGKFKPPHRGHYEFAKRKDVDELLILISPSPKPGVSPQQSLSVWNKYLEAADAPDNIRVEVADYRSPVTSVYEYVADPAKSKKGDTVLLIKSSKDIGDARYEGAQSYAERKNPGVRVELIEEDPIGSSDGEPYHGSNARKAIVNNDRYPVAAQALVHLTLMIPIIVLSLFVLK